MSKLHLWNQSLYWKATYIETTTVSKFVNLCLRDEVIIKTKEDKINNINTKASKDQGCGYCQGLMTQKLIEVLKSSYVSSSAKQLSFMEVFLISSTRLESWSETLCWNSFGSSTTSRGPLDKVHAGEFFGNLVSLSQSIELNCFKCALALFCCRSKDETYAFGINISRIRNDRIHSCSILAISEFYTTKADGFVHFTLEATFSGWIRWPILRILSYLACARAEDAREPISSTEPALLLSSVTGNGR